MLQSIAEQYIPAVITNVAYSRLYKEFNSFPDFIPRYKETDDVLPRLSLQ